MKDFFTARHALASSTTRITRPLPDRRPLPQQPPPAIRPLLPPVKINRKARTPVLANPSLVGPRFCGSNLQVRQQRVALKWPLGLENEGAKALDYSSREVGAEAPTHKSTESPTVPDEVRIASMSPENANAQPNR